MQKVSFDMSIPEITKNYFVEPKMKKTYDEYQLIDAIEKLEKNRYMPSERETKDKLIKYVVGEWFSQKIREKYQELSSDIFELKRKIEINPKKALDYSGREIDCNKKIRLEIPMFAQAELGKETRWKREFEIGDGKYDNYKIRLSSRIPNIPSEVRKARKEAVTLVYNTYSNALNTKILSDVILENPDYAPNPANSKLLVLWKPKPSEIHVVAQRIDRDPALVLKYEKPYLVSTWTEPDEEPFMHLISACRISNLEKFIEKK